MPKLALLFAVGTLLLPWCCLGAPEPAPLPVTCRVMGNGDYLLLTAEVADPNLIGTNTEPMSQPWNDDSIDFFFDLSAGKEAELGPRCFRLAISAAGEGGFAALVGDAAGSWRPNPAWLAGLKYDVALQGTLNKPSDVDRGWTVEVAIPWRFFGGFPPDGATLGFNAVCHMRGENDGFVSWASGCQTEADLERPQTWGKLVLRYSGESQAAQGDQVTCPMGSYPVAIDARLDGNEWMGASVLTFLRPAPQFVRPTASPSRSGRAPLLLALYRYDYQGDPHLPGAGAGLWDEQGRCTLAEHPREGVTPLYSGARPDWHRAQAAEVRRAGIDALLTPWPADGTLAEELAALVEGVKQLRLEGRSHPLLAPYLEVAALPERDLAARPEALYGALWSWLSLVPADLRLQLAPSATGGKSSYVVVVSAPAAEAAWSEQTFATLRSRCERDFGCSLALVLHPGWRAQAPEAADGLCAIGGGEIFFDQSGKLAVASLSPGSVQPLRARMGGRSYEGDWLRVNTLEPDLVLLDSWNDFTRGTAVAPSAEYGVVYADTTRTMFTRMVTRRAVQVSVRRATVPSVMLPGVPYQVELVLRNEGFSDLKLGPRITMVYRLTSTTNSRISYRATAAEGLRLAAGQSAPVTFTVQAGDGAHPLPPGPYQLTFEVTKSSVPLFTSSWFTSQLSRSSFPVTVGQPAPLLVTVLDNGLPGSVPRVGAAPGYLRVRNDGRLPWRGMQLSYEWCRAAASPGEQPRPVGSTVTLKLPDAPPGRAVTAKFSLAAPASGEASDTRYLVRWRVSDGKSEGVLFHSEPVTVASPPISAAVVQADLPALAAGEAGVARVVLRNTGQVVWAAGRMRLAATWLRWDGPPVGAAGESALAVGTGPGQSVVASCPLQAPGLPGSYRLALALAEPGGGTRTLAVSPLAVGGKGLVALDLAQQANVFGSTSDRRCSAGNFDGLGRSFPAEYLPPDLSGAPGPLYPAGYGLFGREAPPVSFRWPDSSTGRGGAVGCRSQVLALEPGSYREIWVVAAGTDATNGTFALIYQDGEQAVDLAVASWLEPAGQVVARTPHHHTIQGDDPAPAYLYGYRLAADPERKLTGLRLPGNERIRVFAVTTLGR